MSWTVEDSPFEIRIYSGQGHHFRVDDKDAYPRSLGCFDRHLKPKAGG
jgi:hypothetical protein